MRYTCFRKDMFRFVSIVLIYYIQYIMIIIVLLKKHQNSFNKIHTSLAMSVAETLAITYSRVKRT